MITRTHLSVNVKKSQKVQNYSLIEKYSSNRTVRIELFDNRILNIDVFEGALTLNSENNSFKIGGFSKMIIKSLQ